MGIRAGILWLLRLGVVVYCATLFAVMAWSFLWPKDKLSEVPSVTAIVCLGAGHTDDGFIGPYSLQRAKTCVDLHRHQPDVPIIFTGISSVELTVAELMAEVAREDGVAENLIVEENHARSTLQNALFSIPYLDPDTPIAIVTDSFHMPRSYVGFRWAGYRDPIPVVSQPRTGEPKVWAGPMALAYEPIKIWFNLLRASVWSLAHRFGLESTVWLM